MCNYSEISKTQKSTHLIMIIGNIYIYWVECVLIRRISLGKDWIWRANSKNDAIKVYIIAAAKIQWVRVCDEFHTGLWHHWVIKFCRSQVNGLMHMFDV